MITLTLKATVNCDGCKRQNNYSTTLEDFEPDLTDFQEWFERLLKREFWTESETPGVWWCPRHKTEQEG